MNEKKKGFEKEKRNVKENGNYKKSSDSVKEKQQSQGMLNQIQVLKIVIRS